MNSSYVMARKRRSAKPFSEPSSLGTLGTLSIIEIFATHFQNILDKSGWRKELRWTTDRLKGIRRAKGAPYIDLPLRQRDD
ncbi:hypothetical protein Trydic_g11470 [Trypoxylus dichotomus]